MRLTPVILALLLALSPGVVAVQTSAPTTSTSVGQSDTVRPPVEGNTTAVMTLGTEAERTAFDSPSLSLGSALSMQRGEFETRLDVATLDQRLAAAETAERKRILLNQFRYRIERQIISLKAEERQVTQAFSNGTISKGEYLRTLGRIDGAAGELHTMARALEKRAEDVGGLSMSNLVSTIDGKLAPLEGPVRDRISKASRGELRSTRVFVATADTGIVLSTIVDDTYVREIVRTDHRDPSAGGSMTLVDARNAVHEQYPWAEEHPSRGTGTDPYGSTSVYSVYIKHPHGTLIAYIDGGTGQVFKEVQHKWLTGEKSLPPGPSVSNSSENVTVTVNRTYAGGPLRVKLTNATGAPLDGQITVAGEPVGRTRGDGVLWTLGPADRFRVSATDGDTTVNVTVTPVEPSPESAEG